MDKEGFRVEDARVQGAEIYVPENAELRDLYATAQFEREITLPDRTRAMVEHLAGLLRRLDPMEKTMVFCVDMEHARLTARLLQNEFSYLGHPDYAVPIISEEGEAASWLDRFQDSDRETPVVATTAELLSTGVDVPSCRNIVFMKPIASPVLFKQIVGRGSRVDPATGKEWFRIIDYVGASRLFDEWDRPPGEPPSVPEGPRTSVLEGTVLETESGSLIVGASVSVQVAANEQHGPVRTDEDGRFRLTELPAGTVRIHVRGAGFRPRSVSAETAPDETTSVAVELRQEVEPARRIEVRNLEVTIADEATFFVEAIGERLTLSEYLDYTRRKVAGYVPNSARLHEVWVDRRKREEFLRELEAASIEVDVLADVLTRPEADQFDLLAHIAFEEPLRTRGERAEAFVNYEQGFMAEHDERAQEVILALLDKYRLAGVGEMTNPEVFSLSPFREMGQMRGVIKRFGGAEALRETLDEMQKRIYREESDLWRACDILRRDNNCGGVMEYVEHISWVLFLKFLDEQESEFEARAGFAGRPYERTVADEYRWSKWVGKALGEPVGEGMRTAPAWDGETLMRFVRGRLIPHLASLSGSPEREVISGVFGDRNVIVCASPYNLKDVLEIVDGINFESEEDVHTVSHFYEGLLRRLGQENKVAGEFYTPRPVLRFLVDATGPRIGETVYDPACGSCGFLVEAHEHMRGQERTTEDHRTLQERTFHGQEKKSVPALLGLMNMVLHGVRTPDVRRRNTLEEDVTRSVSERFDVVLTNPPFGGTENAQIQNNFPIKANATELLFLQHIMKKLHRRDGARCGMVVPEGTLFRGGAFANVKKLLLEDFDLRMVVSLPPGAFAPYSDVKTALLIFGRPGPTKEILYHELPLPAGLKKFSKGSPISDNDFTEAREAWEEWSRYRRSEGPRPEATPRTWIESTEFIAARNYDLSAKNPSRPEDEVLPPPAEITASLLENSRRFHEIVERLDALVGEKERV